jgi:hypothetical protein
MTRKTDQLLLRRLYDASHSKFEANETRCVYAARMGQQLTSDSDAVE